MIGAWTAAPTATPAPAGGEAAWALHALGAPCRRSTVNQLHTRRNIAALTVAACTSTGHRMDAVRIFTGCTYHSRSTIWLVGPAVRLFERIWQEFSVHHGIVTLLATSTANRLRRDLPRMDDCCITSTCVGLPAPLKLEAQRCAGVDRTRLASERGCAVRLGSERSRPARLVRVQGEGPARSGGSDASLDESGPGHLRDAASLLGELTRLLTDDAVPDHITERAGSLLYRYFT